MHPYSNIFNVAINEFVRVMAGVTAQAKKDEQLPRRHLPEKGRLRVMRETRRHEVLTVQANTDVAAGLGYVHRPPLAQKLPQVRRKELVTEILTVPIW